MDVGWLSYQQLTMGLLCGFACVVVLGPGPFLEQYNQANVLPPDITVGGLGSAQVMETLEHYANWNLFQLWSWQYCQISQEYLLTTVKLVPLIYPKILFSHCQYSFWFLSTLLHNLPSDLLYQPSLHLWFQTGWFFYPSGKEKPMSFLCGSSIVFDQYCHFLCLRPSHAIYTVNTRVSPKVPQPLIWVNQPEVCNWTPQVQKRAFGRTWGWHLLKKKFNGMFCHSLFF